jgi:hypothetical protein
MALAGWYFLSINDLGVSNFHAAKHMISALDKDPAFNRWLTGRRIGDLAAKRSIDGEGRGTARQQPENETQHAAQLHT